MIKIVTSALDHLILRLREPAASANVIYVAIYTMLWGVWLLSFNVFDQADLYMVLQGLAPENFFGLAALLAGLSMAASTLYNKYPFTSYGAFGGFLFWGFISIGYFLGNYQHTGGITAMGLSLYCAFMFLNIRLNQKVVHDLHL